MNTGHNHPPRCCCDPDNPLRQLHCPLCPEHGELAQLGDQECTSCHAHAPNAQQIVHTDYCRRQCPDLEPHKAHIRFDSSSDAADPVCPGRLVP